MRYAFANEDGTTIYKHEARNSLRAAFSFAENRIKRWKGGRFDEAVFAVKDLKTGKLFPLHSKEG